MRRLALTLAAALACACPAAAHAAYVAIPAAPGYGPAKYRKVFVDKVGPASAKRVLVLIPGTFGGSGDFRLIAQELVKRSPGLQVWSIDRRQNALEDTSVFRRAIARQVTPKAAFDYYVGWILDSSIQPHYQPLRDADYPFVREWGLKMATEDTRRVVQAAAKGGRTVILGGHSLGASSVLAYATWDFAGRPGFEDVAGLVLIDGGSFGTTRPTTTDVRKRLEDLKATSPFADLLNLNLPWTSGVLAESGAIGTLQEPDAPSVGQASAILPAMFKPSVPATNRAQFGFAFDTKTSPPALGLLQIHSGHVAEAPGADGLHGWVDDGLTPIDNLATLMAHEPGNFVEWYYPKRLSIDVAGAAPYVRTKVSDLLGLRSWHRAQVDRPLYVFQSSLSKGTVIAGARAFVKASKIERATYVDRASTYAHVDMLAAPAARNDLIKTLVPFLKRIR